jgi:hypothetical protein
MLGRMGDANVERLGQWGRSWRTASRGGVFVDSATGEVELDEFDPDVIYEGPCPTTSARPTAATRGSRARSNGGASPTES